LRSKTLGGALPALILALFASTPRLVGQATVATSTGESQGNQRCVAVESVDLGDVNLDPYFADAVYENLLQELAKTNQFRQVFRDGDHYGATALTFSFCKRIGRAKDCIRRKR